MTELTYDEILEMVRSGLESGEPNDEYTVKEIIESVKTILSAVQVDNNTLIFSEMKDDEVRSYAIAIEWLTEAVEQALQEREAFKKEYNDI